MKHLNRRKEDSHGVRIKVQIVEERPRYSSKAPNGNKISRDEKRSIPREGSAGYDVEGDGTRRVREESVLRHVL